TATVPAPTNVLCSGGANGSATVNAAGGTPGYTYLWSPSGGTAATATGLAAGNYSVLITDANGCTQTATTSISQPTVVTATVPAPTNVLCSGGANGSATVNAAGGTPGYTYLWSPSGGTAATATGLAAGNYSVLITDANGCTQTATTSISQPTVVTATVPAPTN